MKVMVSSLLVTAASPDPRVFMRYEVSSYCSAVGQVSGILGRESESDITHERNRSNLKSPGANGE